VARARLAWEDDTVRRRETVAAEFGQWLARVQPVLPVDWDTTTPELVVAYLEGHYAPTHATREIAEGFRGPAGTTLEGWVTHLRCAFKLRGRVCAWGTAPPACCNPCDSDVVVRYVAGYKRQCAQAGHESVAARPWAQAKLGDLMGWLDKQAAALAPGIGRVLIARDQAMLCCMLECGKRGKECGKLRWRDLLDPDNRELQPHQWRPQAGDTVQCMMFDKTHKVRRVLAGTFEYEAGGAGSTNFLWRLEQYVRERATVGLAWGSSGWLFSPQARDRVSFADKPMSSSATGTRLRDHLVSAGLAEGETAHGLRRGRTQALDDMGLAPEEVMSMMGMKSRKTYNLYSDRSRPVRQQTS